MPITESEMNSGGHSKMMPLCKLAKNVLCFTNQKRLTFMHKILSFYDSSKISKTLEFSVVKKLIEMF